VKIDNLNAIAPRIVKITSKWRLQFQSVLAGDFLAHFRDLFFIAHHDAEMAHPAGLQLLHFEDGEELMLAQFEEGVAFTAIELLEIENVFVKRDRFLNVVHFDRDMITAVNLHTHIKITLTDVIAPSTDPMIDVRNGMA
jgi:hypothetical protein